MERETLIPDETIGCTARGWLHEISYCFLIPWSVCMLLACLPCPLYVYSTLLSRCMMAAFCMSSCLAWLCDTCIDNAKARTSSALTKSAGFDQSTSARLAYGWPINSH